MQQIAEPVTDQLQQQLECIHRNPWQIHGKYKLNEETLKLLKRRNVITTVVSKNYRIVRGSKWNNKNNKNNKNTDIEPIEEENLVNHKARYYQKKDKFFRENREVDKCVEDILQCIDRIEHFTSSLTETQFKENELVIAAVKYLLMVIGEAGGVVYVC